MATAVLPAGDPSLILSKEKSKFNGVIEAYVGGFAPGAAITLSWPDGSTMATATADQRGLATTSFRTPLVAFGTYRVTARDTRGATASDTLGVIPRIMLNEEIGPVTTKLRVYFYGFAPGEQVEVRWYRTDVSYSVIKTVLIAPNGRGSSLIAIPHYTGKGAHKVMGRVIGVARSASTSFWVTGGVGGSAAVGEASGTPTPSATASATAIPTPTPTPAETPTVETPSAVETSTVTASPSPDSMAIPTVTATPEPAMTPTEGPTATIVSEPTAIATPTPTPTPTMEPMSQPTAEAEPVTPVAVPVSGETSAP